MERPPRNLAEIPSARQLETLYLRTAEALIRYGEIKDVDMPEAQLIERPQPHMFDFEVPPAIAARILELDETKERMIGCRLSFTQEAVIDEELEPAAPRVFWAIDTLVIGPTGDHLIRTQTTLLEETVGGYTADNDVEYAEMASIERRLNTMEGDDVVSMLRANEQPFTADDARRFQKLADWLLAS